MPTYAWGRVAIRDGAFTLHQGVPISFTPLLQDSAPNRCSAFSPNYGQRKQTETSKHVGVNVEGDFEADAFIHTFALSKDENEV